MSEAQQYYYALLAQGYTPEQANGYMQLKYPGYSPTVPMAAAPQTMPPQTSMPMGGMMQNPQMGMSMGAPMGGKMQNPQMSMPMRGMIPRSSRSSPGVLNWIALGLTLAAITMLFISMFTNSWMTGEDDGYSITFGLYEFDTEFKGTDSVSYDDCNDEECSDMDSAGLTGLIFLWISVGVSICALVLMCLNIFNIFNSKIGMIACFVSGGLAITGAIIWLIMFPELDGLDDLNLGPGISFYLAIIAGVCSIGSGVCEATS